MTSARESRSGRPYRRMREQLGRQWALSGAPCWLCGKAIDYSLRHPHKMSWTFDHVVPVWMGGSDTDPSNGRPAHLSCNSRRSAIETNRKKRAKTGAVTTRRCTVCGHTGGECTSRPWVLR